MNFASPLPIIAPRIILTFAGCQFSYLDKTLANVLTPGEKLCGKKFELRIDDILFIGHPTLVSHNSFNQVERKTSIDFYNMSARYLLMRVIVMFSKIKV